MTSLPARIGRYEVISLLGQGGMGVLYLARDPVIDRHVALKLLKVDNEDLRRRFVREARSAGRLQHPNIVTVYDVGDHDGELFIAMEYIDGDTLATLIRDDVPFSTLRKLELLDQLADGLGFAHQRDIIHRDIKPANLMVTRGGLLKVLDFGIARLARRQAALATMGAGLVGTPAYMAPEQLEGGEVDHRADIFAVGLVMYELLSGRRAFGGLTTAEVMQNVLQEEPIPLDQVLPSADPHLVRCVAKALAKRPDDRYPNLQDLRNDLGRVRRRVELESGAFDATVVVQLPVSRGAGTAVERPRPPVPPEDATPGPAEPSPATEPGVKRQRDTPVPLPLGVQRAPVSGDRVHDADAPTMVVPVMPMPPSASDDGSVLAPVRHESAATRAAVARDTPSPPPVPPLHPAPTPPVPAVHVASAPSPHGHRSMVPALLVLGVVLMMLVVVVLGAWWWVKATLSARLEPAAVSDGISETTGEVAAIASDSAVPATRDEVAETAAASAPAGQPGDVVVDTPESVAPDPTPAASAVATPRRAGPPAMDSPAVTRAPSARPPSPPPSTQQVTADDTVVPSAAAPVALRRPPADDVRAEDAVALVRAYLAARNTAHAAGLRRVWPTVTDIDVRRMTGQFSAPLTLTGCDVQGAGTGRMRAACGFTQPGSTSFSEGTPLTVRRQLVFEIERQDQGWVITSVTG